MLPDLPNGYEGPDVAGVRLAEKGAHSVGASGRVRIAEPRAEVGDRPVQPPEEVGAVLIPEGRYRSGGEGRRGHGPSITAGDPSDKTNSMYGMLVERLTASE